MGNTQGDLSPLSVTPRISPRGSPRDSPRSPFKFPSPKQIVRVINHHVDNQIPDVETLGVSFRAAKLIFTQLSLGDLNRCMQVCKEWRSLIDTCQFWKIYLCHHYGFDVRPPKSKSPLYTWKYKPESLRVATPSGQERMYDSLKRDEPEMVFQPFPDLWSCGVLVPYATSPVHGSLEMYHNFVKALRWLEIMQSRCKDYKLGHEVQTCLFPWSKSWMPHPREVLDLFKAHREVIRSCKESGGSLTRQELQSCYTLLVNSEGKPQFEHKFYQGFVAMAGANSLAFSCSNSVADPAPAFIVTELAPGWIGGLLYAC